MQPLNQMSERSDGEVQMGINSAFGKAIEELLTNSDWKAIGAGLGTVFGAILGAQ